MTRNLQLSWICVELVSLCLCSCVETFSHSQNVGVNLNLRNFDRSFQDVFLTHCHDSQFRPHLSRHRVMDYMGSDLHTSLNSTCVAKKRWMNLHKIVPSICGRSGQPTGKTLTSIRSCKCIIRSGKMRPQQEEEEDMVFQCGRRGGAGGGIFPEDSVQDQK